MKRAQASARSSERSTLQQDSRTLPHVSHDAHRCFFQHNVYTTKGQLSHLISPYVRRGPCCFRDGARHRSGRANDDRGNARCQFQHGPPGRKVFHPPPSALVLKVRVPRDVITSFPTGRLRQLCRHTVEGLVRVSMHHWRRGYPPENVCCRISSQAGRQGEEGGYEQRVCP